MKTRKEIDMLNGSLTPKLIGFAIPIALSSMLQQLFNAADTSIVGICSDANALAAVGTNGEIVAFLVTVSAGLAVGANVLVAKLIGESHTGIHSDRERHTDIHSDTPNNTILNSNKNNIGKSAQSAEYGNSKISAALHTSMVMAIILGIIFSILGVLFAKPVITMIHTPSEVLSGAVTYLRIYCLGLPFLMIYDFGSAILRSKGDSRYPFIALTISGIANVLLNLLFVAGLNLGVMGVAIATDIATAISASAIIFRLAHESTDFRLNFCKLAIDPDVMKRIFAIGIPAALQGAVFCFANIFVQAAVNDFGAVATAGSAIAMNFEYFAYYMITAFGQTATTFTSQNYAAGQKKRCMKILHLLLIISVFFCAAITVPITVMRTGFSGLFSNDPRVIAAACQRVMLILLFEPICCLYEIPAGFLRGLGHSTLPAVITIVGTCLLRILWIFSVFAVHPELSYLFVIFPISWVVTITLMLISIGYVIREDM